MMPKNKSIISITVYHPRNVQINGGYTLFSGPNVACDMETDGSLTIGEWETETQKGYAYFASGQWAYICVAEDKGS